MSRTRLRQALLASTCIGLMALLWSNVRADLASRRDLHRESYLGSRACQRCHTEHTASWRRTFHRTMTQAADETSVRGDFSGATLEYFGVQARMERGPSGEFLVRYGAPGDTPRTYVIEKTIGSRRYQQYVARRGTELVRLPIAFHLEEGRWFHMNGAFLTQDPSALPASMDDFERHVTRWNDNCVFCHNVHPNPGKRGQSFATEVAELGIGCEACHGPGEEHAARNTNPLRRYALHLSHQADPSIVNPKRLSPERSADLCGRCHGQRITDDVNAFLTRGDPFVPGDDLAQYSAPLWHDSTLQGRRDLFAPRFWADGTPRLTAYEYQGLLLSACSQRGPLTCIDCHGMHEGDPRGQLRESKQGAAMCTGCHEQLGSPAQQVAHARHGEAPPACIDCHMPPLVYGVLSAHRSHRIEIPSPARAAATERPDACTLCHVDRTRAWAIRESARLFGGSAAQTETSPWSEIETRLFSGDPIERALAAAALERAANQGLDQAARKRRAALLLEALEQDPYPVVRRFAARALARVEPASTAALASFAPESAPSRRKQLVSQLRARLGTPSVSQAVLAELRSRAASQAIDIGE